MCAWRVQLENCLVALAVEHARLAEQRRRVDERASRAHKTRRNILESGPIHVNVHLSRQCTHRIDGNALGRRHVDVAVNVNNFHV